MDNNNKTHRQHDDFMTIADLWHLCRAHWAWYVISVAILVVIAGYYLVITPNMYTREASVLVKEENTGKNASKRLDNDDFNDIGLVTQKTNVANVRRELTSLEVLTEVARRVCNAKNNTQAINIAKSIKDNLQAEIEDDKSTIINLKYISTSPKQAERVLYAIVQVYNEKWLENKNQLMTNTSQFIEARLRLLEDDLDNVDDSISVFKTRNKITDLEHVSDIYLQQQSQSESEILRITNQKAMAKYLLDILKSKGTQRQLLPTNSGINNQMAESQIAHYNSLLLQLRNNMVGTSSQNPLIAQQEADLDDIRKNILSTLESQIKSLDIQLNALQGYNSEANSKITSNPNQAKHLVSVEREQKVKESLYLYLLQKKEENEISMTYTAVNTKIIDMPNGSDTPTSPNNRMVLFAAVILALIIPTVVLFAKESMDNTVRDKQDIERNTTLSLIGEVPFNGTDKNKLFAKLLKHESGPVVPFVVEAGKQDYINEAFRLIRTNMEFMTARHGERNVYIVTSNYPEAGKTFVAMNVALALAIAGKHVLFIDGDLRHASASHMLKCNDIGIADYLGERETDLSVLIHHSVQNDNLDILPVGTIPPNPTELLSTERLPELMALLRPLYDFIIVDCPPVESLADVGIIEQHADRTLFVIRAGVFERRRLSDLETSVENNKYKHLSLILNATKVGGRYGYGYRYGYRYGYHYGYYHHKKSAKRQD